MQDFTNSPQISRVEPSPNRRSHAIWWLLGGCATVATIGFVCVIAVIAYMGIYTPNTSVYTGNRIPSRFLSTIESVGALEDDEKILYFYSDALTDIRDGFYFVSDRKVVIYSQALGGLPLTAIPFDEIADAEMYRNESFFEDSEITLYLEDGQVLSFPVSSEHGRDQQFFDAIYDRTTNASESR